MRTLLSITLIFLLAFPSINAQVPTTLRDTLISDFNSFIEILEQTHPDPYSRFGG